MLCRNNEDVLSGREQVCIKREGEIEDQVKKLKMCELLVQQQENACAQREKCVGDKEVRLMGTKTSLNKRTEELGKREDVFTRREQEIAVALRNMQAGERNCDAKLKKFEDDTKKLSKVEREMKLLEKNVSNREEVCKQREGSLIGREASCKLLKSEVCCLSNTMNDRKQACERLIDSAKVRSKELREGEVMWAKREEDLASRIVNVTEREN
jgi:uncharacterized protein (DUF3084 family)